MSAASRSGYRILLEQLIHDGVNFRWMKRVALLLILAEAILLVLQRVAPPMPVNLLLICMPWGLAQIWCGMFMKSAVLQNRPEYACLVPQLRRRLLSLTAAVYGVSSLLLALLTGVAFGHPGYGLLAGVAISVLSIWMNRFTALAWGMVLVIPSVIPLFFNVLPAILIAVDQEVAITVGGVLSLSLLGVWGLTLVFPQGGERHWAWHARHTRQQDALSGKAPKSSAIHGPQRWEYWLRSFYARTLRRDSHPGIAATRTMMHVLGPAAHPASYIVYAVLATAIALLVAQYLLIGSARSAVLAVASVLQLSASLGYVIGVVDNIPRYRAEQRLYFLTPAAPLSAEVNRQLGQALLGRFLAVWLVTLACACLLDSVAIGAPGLHGSSFALAMGMLWLARPLMRDFAAALPGKGRMDGIIASALVAIAMLATLAMTQAAPAFPWYAIGVVTGVAAAIDLSVSWRKLMRLAPVLPAGRLA